MALSPTEIQLTLSLTTVYIYMLTLAFFSFLATAVVCTAVQIMYGYVSAYMGVYLPALSPPF